MADGLITREPPDDLEPGDGVSTGDLEPPDETGDEWDYDSGRSVGEVASSVVAWLRRPPWWFTVLAVFAASRVISTVFLLLFASFEPTNQWTVRHPDYFSFTRIWDGQWYGFIAQYGYPKTLPLVNVNGVLEVGQNQWAFLPVYPFLVRGFMLLTGAPFPQVGVFVAVAAAAGCALVFFRLMRRFLPEGSALFAVVLFCVAPLSPLLQVTYAESLFLLLICVSLLLLLQRRYWWMLVVLGIAAFTRPGVVAFGLALALHWGFRWYRRRTEPFPRRERATVAVVAVATALLGLTWPVVAAVVTGDAKAYTATELSWRADYIGYGKLLPFASWIQGANWWFPGGEGLIFLAVAVVLFGLFLVSPWARRLPVDLRFWVVSYVLYLLAVFFPQSSTFRVLMPIFPLLGALAVPRSRVFRLALVLVALAGQWVWIYFCWYVNGYDWTPP